MSHYTFPYASSFPCGDGDYQGHGRVDQYYDMPSTSRGDNRYYRDEKKKYDVESRSRSASRSRSRSKTRSRSSTSSSRRDRVELGSKLKFTDTFRVLYLTRSKSKNNTSKYLVIKKKQDRIQEFLKRDGLGSKHWLFYPRPKDTVKKPEDVRDSQTNCDKRIKVDGDFFKKCKRTKNLDTSGPIAKLKTWELIFYKKLGFIQAV
ncbi:uncharacterized protein LOC121730786 [Aricia agestis]|uniref:uncharacterized protein LOC121730786 n=1 Tax=Aricia agestis TaxID=91739 RepID=UPI001C20B5DA|nr:uncharacterized protein LOC121730786 [Aricia agestis]